MKKTHTHYWPLLTALCLSLPMLTQAALVGPTGYTNDFSARPLAADFASSIDQTTGTAAEIITAAAMDNFVQTIAAGAITSQLIDSSPTNPPLRQPWAQWTSGGSGYMMTRPTGNKASIILATLVNNTGTNCTTLHLNYNLTVNPLLTEEVWGLRVYYSFSPAPNAWTCVSNISALTASQLVSGNVFLNQAWNNGAPLYLLWVDDNSANSVESVYEIDNFFASAYYQYAPVSIGLVSPTNGAHFGEGAPIKASVTLSGTPTNVSYYVDDSLAVERTAFPFSPVELPALTPGSHTIYASAMDASNMLVTTITNSFVVDPGFGGLIATNTTLYASNNPYYVTANVIVDTNVTLTVEPGVKFQIRQGCGFNVYGRLLVNGATNQPVIFTRYPGDLNWERLMFVEAQDSVLRNCVIEYSNCAGDHKYAYYATNCAYPMNVGPRSYFEAIVGLACHLDIEGCVFTNLYTPDGTLPEGDAIGIFSDDLVHRGPASANIRGCKFLYIGQGVNTRYAYALVENCYFVGKTGDNDDVELYGEPALYNLPNPLVRSNFFDIPCYDDRIHPTRCSAIISDNIIYGDTAHGDHAMVLRDTCCPIVFNNIIFNTPSGGIAIENGCDALILNNTFYGVSRAIKLFDFHDRINYPYCLSSMSGRATVINNIIWNGNNAIDVSGAIGSAFTRFQVDVSYCDIQGGTGSIATGSSAYTVNWGPGIINTDPGLFNPTAKDAHITSGSPCIDAGIPTLGTYLTTNTYFEGTTRTLFTVTNDLGALITNDKEGRPRPLDGNGDGMTRFDIGAYELFLPTADSNNDGIPDDWCVRYGLSPNDPTIASQDTDGDGQTNLQEYLAGTNPVNPESYPHILGVSGLTDGTISWTNAYEAGVVSVFTSTNLNEPWKPRENHFTTNTSGQAQVNVEGENTFYKLLAVDISTNTPAHFTNLANSYGILETVAGRGLSNSDYSQWQPSFEGDWATNVCLSRPHIAFGDSRTNVLIVDQRSSSVLKVTPDGRLYTFAGTHTPGYNGDSGWATNMMLNYPNSGWLATNDVLYVMDTDNKKIRRISPDGYMTTLFTFTNGNSSVFTNSLGDGRALWVKSDESLAYFGSQVVGSADTTSKDIYKWTPTEGITLYRAGFSELGNIVGDERTGNLYVSDRGANRVYCLDADKVLTTIAGNGTATGSGGDGYPALQSSLYNPRCVSFLPNGGWFTCEHDGNTSGGNSIWYIDPAGIMHLWMKGGTANYSRVGDGQWFYASPTTPKICRVRSCIPDIYGNLIIVENNYGYVLRIRFERMP